MAAPAGYTQGVLGYYWKTSDNSGPYALGADGVPYLIAGSLSGSGSPIAPGVFNLYVNKATGSDSRDGLTPATAFATLQRSSEAVAAYRVGNGNIVVNIADGDYLEDWQIQYEGISQNVNDDSAVTYKGNAGNPLAVRTTSCWVQGGRHLFREIHFTSWFAGDVGKNVCVNCRSGSFEVASGQLILAGNMELAGNNSYGLLVEQNGSLLVRAAGTQLNFIANPTYAAATALAHSSGTIIINGCPVVGTAVGQRSMEYTGGQVIVVAPSVLPGTLPAINFNFGYNSQNTGGSSAQGLGAAVAQTVSKATAVASDTLCCDITLNAASLAAGAIVSFTFTNNKIIARDILDVFHVSGGTLGGYTFAAQTGAGSATIFVRNATAGALAEAIVLRTQVRRHQLN